jgi:hypothetical protein
MRSSLAIDELAAHRALTALPDVWVDLLHGRLAADEAAAAAADREPAELVERSKTLFLAPSAEAEEARLEALLAAHFAEPRRRAAPRGLYGGVVALLAASVLLVWFLGRAPAFDGGYSLELSAGYLDERDAPVAVQGVTRYREGQRMALVLRPRDTVTTEVGVVVFAVAEGRSTKLAIEPEINEHRVVTIVGTPETLGLTAGRWQLKAVVGPPEHLPQALEAVQDGAEAPYDVRTAEVEIVPASAPPLP